MINMQDGEQDPMHSSMNVFNQVGGSGMPPLPLIFSQCRPRPEILAGELPDAIFAADLWDVITGQAHDDYRDPARFFSGTHPTENLKLLVKEVTERLAGVAGGTPVFRLETGFGGGKTHSLIATVHAARFGEQLAVLLENYRIDRFPGAEDVRVAAFVGEESDPLAGNEHLVDEQRIRTYTPWGQICLLAGGLAGYELVKENDIQGVAPARGTLEQALGDKAVLILLDELVLYMARGFALAEDHPRHKVNSQWPTFFQTLFSIASRRARTSVIVTLPSEQDANRRLTGEFKQYLPTILETVDELEQTASRHARNLTPTQTFERAAVLGRRLFESVDSFCAADIAKAYTAYYEEQRSGGVQIEERAFEAGYAEQICASYPFHPEFVRLFAERLADIPEFQATRGALHCELFSPMKNRMRLQDLGMHCTSPKRGRLGMKSVVLLFLTEKPGCRRLMKPWANSAPG
jgi:predicted AAA+ superfamily ATPase